MPRLPKDKFGAVTFVVRGRGEFPIDMLRYDSAVPLNGSDVTSVATDWAPGAARNVTLRRFYPAGGVAAPTVERWRSFGWVVVEVHP